ncbi:MAG TPA: thiamine-phosphate kinase [Gammaproteobacteria bacterium]|nr:thiamine-phosphate kinase [Gammaproteobacteria bacterium]
MGVSEFDLIRRHFSNLGVARPDVVLGVGDDAALLNVPPDQELAVSLDTLVAGVHFPPDTAPAAVGHKALAVGLSDLAAMGAAPAWFTLGITLPEADERWLAAFCEGLGLLAREYGLQLVGGDTTRGPLAVSLQVHGLVPRGQALRRSGARPGDHVYVTGTLGDAALALRLLEAGGAPPGLEALRRRLDRPTPRVREGLALRGLAHAAIDVSDGLCADLGHILEASGVGATLEVETLPLSPAFREAMPLLGREACLALALSGGDDYELCFTADPADEAALGRGLEAVEGGLRKVGEIVARPGLRCVDSDGRILPCAGGYDHFGGGDP